MHEYLRAEDLSKVQAEKREFVQNRLLPLLADIDKKVTSVEYRVSECGGEYVVIERKDDSPLTITVTYDSLAALTRDVMKVF